jgi:outer membrane lipoprotein SlyB
LATGRSGAEGDQRAVAQSTSQPEVVRAPPLKSTQQFAAGPQQDQPSSTRSVPARQPQPAAPVQAQKPDTRSMGNGAPACRNCGVVESATAVQRKVPVQGIANTQITAGAVAGGVIGGLLGNQVGNGSGRTAATVLGAAGGAYAGNEVQKNMNKVTVYQVRVRMNDGSVRTVEQSHPVAAGARVAVNNGALRVL